MSCLLNDPTRSGPPMSVATGKTLRLSRNEVESVCTKAARGAGMSWGLAEEAGYAAGWLVSQGFDGARMLARHLHNAHGKPWHDICPVVQTGEWGTSSAGQPLCPIALGATLSDHLAVDDTLFDDPGLSIAEVNSPILVLPFLALAVETLKRTIFVYHEDDVVHMAVNGMVSGDVSVLLTVDRGTLVITVDKQTTNQRQSLPVNRTEPASVDSEALTILHELSMRTTVPASASSRANAGATGSDND